MLLNNSFVIGSRYSDWVFMSDGSIAVILLQCLTILNSLISHSLRREDQLRSVLHVAHEALADSWLNLDLLSCQQGLLAESFVGQKHLVEELVRAARGHLHHTIWIDWLLLYL